MSKEVELKIVIDIFKSEIFTLSKYLENKDMAIFHGRSFKQTIRAMQSAITFLEAIKKAGEELPKKDNPCRYDNGSSSRGYQHGYNDAVDKAQPILAKKDIRIKELEQELESDCCADNCQEVAMLQAKITELEEQLKLWKDGVLICSEKEIDKLQAKIDELEKELEEGCCTECCEAREEAEAKVDELEHRHQSLMKALDDDIIYSIIDKTTLENKGGVIKDVVAKAITDFIKSELTGGERWR